MSGRFSWRLPTLDRIVAPTHDRPMHLLELTTVGTLVVLFGISVVNLARETLRLATTPVTPVAVLEVVDAALLVLIVVDVYR